MRYLFNLYTYLVVCGAAADVLNITAVSFCHKHLNEQKFISSYIFETENQLHNFYIDGCILLFYQILCRLLGHSRIFV